MFFEKIKNGKWLILAVLAITAVLFYTLSGCGCNAERETDTSKSEDSVAVSEKTTAFDVSISDDETTIGEDTSETDAAEADVPETDSTEDDAQENTTTKKNVTEAQTATTEETAATQKETTAQTTTEQQTTTQAATTQQTTTQEQTTAASPAEIKISTPVASGTLTVSQNGYTVDYSNSSSGYIMVKGSESYSGTIAVQVFKDGTSGTLLAQYVAANTGEYVTFSLTGGSGSYTVRVMEQRTNGYSPQLTTEFTASISSETQPYLYPTYIVNFTASSQAVSTASQVCAGCTTDEEKVLAVKKYVINTLEYDDSKASDVKAGNLKYYTPDVDSVLSKGKGICYDYAALFAAMLRCQGIPVRLVKGYAGSSMEYHAWNEAYYNGSWHTIDCTYEDGGQMASSYTVTSYN